MIRAFVVMASAAVALVFSLTCDHGDPISIDGTVTLTLTPGSGAVAPGGWLVPLSVRASSTADDVGAAGLPITFASSVTGATIVPASATTDPLGRAVASLLIPYATTVIATATTTGNGSDQKTLVAPTAKLVLGSDGSAGSAISGGRMITMIATVTVGGSNAPGVSVSFSTNASGVAFVPTPVMTGSDGTARSQVAALYSATPLIANATAGGASDFRSLTDLLPSVSVATDVCLSDATGLDYRVSATLTTGAPSETVEGVTVGFAVLGSTSSGDLFSPTSAPTNGSGVATSFLTLAAGSAVEAVISVAGTPITIPVPGGSVPHCP